MTVTRTLLLSLAMFMNLALPVFAQEGKSSPEDREALSRLADSAALAYDNSSLKIAVDFIVRVNGLKIEGVDKIPAKAKISLDVQDITLSSLLSLMLGQADLTYRVRGGAIVILRLDEVRKEDLPLPAPPKKTQRKVLRKLKRTTVELEFEGGSLPQLLQQLSTLSKVSIVVDWRRIKSAGIKIEVPVEALSGKAKLLKLLHQQLDPHKLAAVYRHEVLLVTTKEAAKKKTKKAKK